MKAFINKNRELCVLVLLLLLIVVIPLVFLRIPSGHDYKYHMGRIWQISQNIDHGRPFAPLYFGQLNGHGYASPLFYGDILLHLPGAAVSLGLPVEAALRLYIVLCFCAAALVTFFLMKRITGSPLAALVTSVLYTFSSYLSVDCVTRVALGEVQAFIFLPIAFAGLYSILAGDCKQWLMLPLGLFGVLISHTLSAAILTFFFFIIALFYIPRLWREKRRIGLICVSVVIFFGVSAFYLLPMLEQLTSASLRLNDGTSATIWGTLAQRAMSPWQTISDFNLSKSNDPWIPNGIGLAIPVSIVTATVMAVRKKPVRDIAIICSALTLLCLIAASTIFPWDSLQALLGNLQFPWRLLMFATLFGAIVAGFAVASFKNNGVARYFSLAVIVLSLFSCFVTATPKIKTMIKYEVNNTALKEDWHDSLGGVEYLPSGTPWGSMQNNGAVAATNDKNIRQSLKVERDFDVTTVSFTGTTADDAYIKVPLVMYKGYEAYDQNGSPVALRGERGYVIADVPGMTDGVITVRYAGTAIQTVSKIISLLTVIALIIYINRNNLKRIIRKRCQRNNPPQAAAV